MTPTQAHVNAARGFTIAEVVVAAVITAFLATATTVAIRSEREALMRRGMGGGLQGGTRLKEGGGAGAVSGALAPLLVRCAASFSRTFVHKETGVSRGTKLTRTRGGGGTPGLSYRRVVSGPERSRVDS